MERYAKQYKEKPAAHSRDYGQGVRRNSVQRIDHPQGMAWVAARVVSLLIRSHHYALRSLPSGSAYPIACKTPLLLVSRA